MEIRKMGRSGGAVRRLKVTKVLVCRNIVQLLWKRVILSGITGYNG
jgi:hypothetical protein